MLKSTHSISLIIIIVFSFLYGSTRRLYDVKEKVIQGTTQRAIEVTPNQPADVLWKALCMKVPNGVTITRVAFGDLDAGPVLSGTYKNIPPINGVQMKDGIILTSGKATNCIGPNNQTGMSTEHGESTGDPDLAQAVGEGTNDCSVLIIEFTSDTSIKGISFDFVFGTEEYPEWVGEYNDAFLCLLDGQNICFDKQGNLISVNNAFFDIDNQGNTIDLEYDGFTYVLRTSKRISEGTHTVKFVIGDTRDRSLDSGVFLSNFVFKFTQDSTNPVKYIIEDQEFIVPENTPEKTVIGKIKKLCPETDVSLSVIKDVNDFTVDLQNWDILVADGAIIDYEKQKEYTITVKAVLKLSSGDIHDTADMHIIITDELEQDPFPHIKESIIYDDNGNGIGDKIRIEFKLKCPEGYSFKNATFSWPENQIDYDQQLSQNDLIDEKTIQFKFTPENNAPIWTKGTSTIKVFLDSLGKELSRTSDLLDGIGPLLEEARVLKRYEPGNDTFFVRITEPVQVAKIKDKSFILIKKDHTKEIEIAPIDAVEDLGGESHIRFAVKDLTIDAPAPGDSLKILHTGPVADKPNNKAHQDNIPVPLKFINTNVPVKNAHYYDHNGDGIVEQVRVEFLDDLKTLDDIECEVEWTDIKLSGKITDTKFESGSKKIVLLDLTGIFPDKNKIIDKTSGEMILTVSYNTRDIRLSHTVIDKAAPVITKAVYCPYITPLDEKPDKDTLVIDFSEHVNDIEAEKPFLLQTEFGDDYHFLLSQMNREKNRVILRVNKIVGVEEPITDDSIWINANKGVEDNRDNEQVVKDNKKVALVVKTRPFTLQPYVIGPKEPDDKKIPSMFKISDKITKGTIIILDPNVYVRDEVLKQVFCEIHLFDPVGNGIAQAHGFDDHNGILEMGIKQFGNVFKIVVLWSDTNLNKRIVSAGAYLAVFDIVYPDGKREVKKIIVPLKR